MWPPQVLGWKQKVISNSLMSLEWLDIGLVCLDVKVQAPRSLLLFFSPIWQTQLITGAGDASTPHIHSHTNTPRGWPFQAMFSHFSDDKLVMGLFMHAVSFRYHPVGTEAPAECWQTHWFWLSSSPSTLSYCCLQLLSIQLFGTPAGNNLCLSDKVESAGV